MYEIALISRPKLNLLGVHYGVDLGNGKVLDPQQEGIKIVSRKEFAKGHPVVVEAKRITSIFEWMNLFTALNEFKYDLIDNNCEHVSRSVVEKKKESRQVQFVAIALIVAITGYLISKK